MSTSETGEEQQEDGIYVSESDEDSASMNVPGVELPQLATVHPKFLHSNSTTHTWVFGAFAELIDNVHDLTTGSSSLLRIDALKINGSDWCITFTDNGSGLSRDDLLKMLSFGYSDKRRKVNPIGQYGNGFKSASMRIGTDALVFTKMRQSPRTLSLGFLSQTYLDKIQANSVVVPVVEWDVETEQLLRGKESLEVIKKYSIFAKDEEILNEFKCINVVQDKPNSGTRIIIYNLRKDRRGDKLELDLESTPQDILNPQSTELDGHYRPEPRHVPAYQRSLMNYCKILYLESKLTISVRGQKVKKLPITDTLEGKVSFPYKPKFLKTKDKPLMLTFGMARPGHDYGMCMYYRGRLIKAYEKIGCQKQKPSGSAQNPPGFGVVGVVDVYPAVDVVHNKQDFVQNERYNACMNAFNVKLRHYWVDKNNVADNFEDDEDEDQWTWIECSSCSKYRRLTDGTTADDYPEDWYCSMNTDPAHNRCDIPQEKMRQTAITALDTTKKRKSPTTKRQVDATTPRKKARQETAKKHQSDKVVFTPEASSPKSNRVNSRSNNNKEMHGTEAVDKLPSSDEPAEQQACGIEQFDGSATTSHIIRTDIEPASEDQAQHIDNVESEKRPTSGANIELQTSAEDEEDSEQNDSLADTTGETSMQQLPATDEHMTPESTPRKGNKTHGNKQPSSAESTTPVSATQRTTRSSSGQAAKEAPQPSTPTTTLDAYSDAPTVVCKQASNRRGSAQASFMPAASTSSCSNADCAATREMLQKLRNNVRELLIEKRLVTKVSADPADPVNVDEVVEQLIRKKTAIRKKKR